LLLNGRRERREEEMGVEEYVGTKPLPGSSGAFTEKGISFQLKVVKKA